MSPASAGQDVARQLMDDGCMVVTGMLTPPGAQAARADQDRVLRTTRTGRDSFEGFDTQRIYACSPRAACAAGGQRHVAAR